MQSNKFSHVLLFVFTCGIVFGSEPEIKLSHSQVSCSGGSDGEIAISMSNISEPVFLSVEEISAQKNFTKKFIDDTVYVLDNLGATKIIISAKTESTILLQEEILMLEPEPLIGTGIEIIQAPSSDDSCDAIIKVQAKGGSPPYSYMWSENANSSSSELIKDVCMGIYRCEINDSKLCGPVHISIPLFKGTIDNYSTSNK